MRLRIERLERVGVTTVRIIGWLEGAGVEELRWVCEEARLPLQLDLSELRAADPRGLDALLCAERAGAELISVPPYLDLLLGSRRQRARDGDPGR